MASTLLPLGDAARPLRVAVVGSGPSAFYAVDALYRVGGLHCRIDMFERLPTPFGLVRGGVAPDHQKIKSVARVYEQIADRDGFRFFGNVTIGRDLSLEELRTNYDAVILAVGAESDRRLGVPGEELHGVHAATGFVGWYNGHPDHLHHEFDLANAERVAIVGNGNVAMDVARILVQDPQRLATTDISDAALEVLRRSRVRDVVVLGRRGPAQAAFSPKELEEIAELDGVEVVVDPSDIELDPASRAELERAGKSAQRNVRVLSEIVAKERKDASRRVHFRFLAAPEACIGEGGRVRGLRVRRSRLEPDELGVLRAVPTDTVDYVAADLVFKAVGYRGIALAGAPFDERSGTIPNTDGRVVDRVGGAVVPHLYVVGWAKRGPTGLIGTNSPDSKATVESLVADLAARSAPALDADDLERTPRLLRERGVEFVSLADWRVLDRHEQEAGAADGRPRRKATDVAAMLAVIAAARAAKS